MSSMTPTSSLPGAGIWLDAEVVARSGLFDGEWYRAEYLEGQAVDPLMHFCREGSHQEFAPNAYFDPAWYARTYGDELDSLEHPLMHYIRVGERENAWPSPHFDPEWYRDVHAITAVAGPLAHYLARRSSGTVSPLPVFDAAAYSAAHPNCLAEEGADPYWHWLAQLDDEGEDPPFPASPFAAVLAAVGGNLEEGNFPETINWKDFAHVLGQFAKLIPFDQDWYLECYPDVAAAVASGEMDSAHAHFLEHGFFEGRSPGAPETHTFTITRLQPT